MTILSMMDQKLKNNIVSKKATIGVIGLGHVGLPLSIALGTVGFSVFGIDNDSKKIALLKKKKSYITYISDSAVGSLIAKGRFFPTTDFSVLKKTDVILVCVPTPIDAYKVPDTRAIEESVSSIAKNLKKGQLIIIESTTYPGCTEELVGPMLEKTKLRAGKDFFLAFSPERIDPGNKNYGVNNVRKVVGGIDENSTNLAALFYEQFSPKPFIVTSPRTAEMVKLLENIFRVVNISFINEFKLICDKMDLDVWEVIEAAKTKPYGFVPFYPSPGIGGHCISVDPFYLSWKVKSYGFFARFIELAAEINELMPHEVVTKVNWALNQKGKPLNNAKILVLGVAYKKDVGDTRETPAEKIIWDLRRKKALVSYHDPYVPQFTVRRETLTSIPLGDKELASADLVLILTNHSSIDYAWVAKKATLVIDTRNAVGQRYPHVIRF